MHAGIAERLLDGLLAVALAPACAACGASLERPVRSAVCEACWYAVLAPAATFCRSPEGSAITCAAAIGDYEGALREILHAFKYRGRRTLGREISALMRTHGAKVLAGADAVVPVPLHWLRQWRRGFNQSAELAAGLGLPVLHALRRSRHTPSQTGLPADQRKDNVRRAFRICRGIRPANLCLVMVDDVSTTGATLEACARELARMGAREVRALTAARVATRLPAARRG